MDIKNIHSVILATDFWGLAWYLSFFKFVL